MHIYSPKPQSATAAASIADEIVVGAASIAAYIDEMEGPTRHALACGAIPAIEVAGDHAAAKSALDEIKLRIQAIRSLGDRLPGSPRPPTSSLSRAA